MEIDFGGIGKEYAADRIATILAERGVAHALVNLGGDVRALGGQADGRPWRVGIRHPRAQPVAAIASIEIADGAVATSGDYERGFDLDGRRYCHLLDPRTGWPVQAWQAISVVAPLAIVAGSCATIAMLLEERAEAFLGEQAVAWLGVDAAGGLHGTLASVVPVRH
jgi:thiamine biosynthesis lipoprotein